MQHPDEGATKAPAEPTLGECMGRYSHKAQWVWKGGQWTTWVRCTTCGMTRDTAATPSIWHLEAAAPAMVMLHELEPSDLLRSLALARIGAQVRNKNSKASAAWQTVTDSWAIAEASFNDLGTAWTDNSEFRAPRP